MHSAFSGVTNGNAGVAQDDPADADGSAPAVSAQKRPAKRP
jgi:hypothetical protein